MDAVMDTPVVATVDAPRRRDEVLPEHEERWPATLDVQDAIAERYDGTAATAHEIGLELVTVKHGCYPGWRVEQIAQGMGIADEKRDAIIERVRAEDATDVRAWQQNRPTGKPVRGIEEAIAVVNNGPATPMRQMLREDLQAIAGEPTCRECGEPFAPWRRWKGRLVTTGTCHACFSAKVKKDAPADISSAPAVEPDETLIERKRAWSEAQPEPEPEPVYVAVPNFPLVFAAPAASAASAEDAEDAEDADDGNAAQGLAHSGAIRELLDLLPTTGRWSGTRRYRWLSAFTATLDLLIDDDRDDETREALR